MAPFGDTVGFVDCDAGEFALRVYCGKHTAKRLGEDKFRGYINYPSLRMSYKKSIALARIKGTIRQNAPQRMSLKMSSRSAKCTFELIVATRMLIARKAAT